MLSETATAVVLSALQKPGRPRLARRLLPALALLAALWFSLFARGAEGADCNAVVLAQVQAMPRGGGYSAGRTALERLSGAVEARNGSLAVRPAGATPSFCSEATYLVFLKTVEALAGNLGEQTAETLLVRAQADGHGVWGRWNANGPGTARLFRELGLGRNFDDPGAARPGDFLKIFWSPEVGCRERGHSVIYLGREWRDGVECLRFWSSNIPGGYGEKTVPRSKIAYAIFSRLEHPEALARLASLAPADPYLARLNAIRSTPAEARAMSGI